MKQFPIIDSVAVGNVPVVQNYTTSFLDEVNANYVWRIYDDKTCALSLEAVYTFLYALATLTANDDHVREIPHWERETTYDVAIMLAMTELQDAEYSPIAERHKHIQKFREYVEKHHFEDSSWQRRVDCLLLFTDLSIPNTMTIPSATGRNEYTFKAQRCMADAWRIFPTFMTNPRAQFLSQSAWNAACFRVVGAMEYCATKMAYNILARLYPYFDSQRNNYVNGDHKITLGILEQQAIIAQAQAQIVAIRSGCTHPKESIMEYAWGNSGNYDPSSDCYGREDTCKICGNVAHFQTEHGRNGYFFQYNTSTSLPAKTRDQK